LVTLNNARVRVNFMVQATSCERPVAVPQIARRRVR
jgi:hypothetical protein